MPIALPSKNSAEQRGDECRKPASTAVRKPSAGATSAPAKAQIRRATRRVRWDARSPARERRSPRSEPVRADRLPSASPGPGSLRVARSKSAASRCIARRPERRDNEPDGDDLREERQRLFLHLRRGLHDRDDRADERGTASIGKAINAVVTSASRRSPSSASTRLTVARRGVTAALRECYGGALRGAGRHALAARSEETIARVAGERLSV